MSSLYDRAEIYDLLESEKRNEATRRDWQGFLGGRSIRTLLDVSIGTGGMTLPLPPDPNEPKDPKEVPAPQPTAGESAE